jgi:hypothetical protein
LTWSTTDPDPTVALSYCDTVSTWPRSVYASVIRRTAPSSPVPSVVTRLCVIRPPVSYTVSITPPS